MKTAGYLVGLAFVGRDIAHRAHLSTPSFSEHMALDTFYHEIIERVDAFVEAYQGRYNELLEIPLVENEFEGEISDVLNQQLAWIEDNREDVCPGTERALHNLIDEIVTLYQRTLYKLRFIS